MTAVTSSGQSGDVFDPWLYDFKWDVQTVTYSFPDDGSYYSYQPNFRVSELSEAQKDAVRRVFDEISSFTGLDFVEVTETSTNEADLRFYEALLPKRNVNMAVRSARLMEDYPEKSYVFAYGTLHFIGRDSVPDLLREQGYTVTRLLAPPDNEVLQEEEVEEAAEEALDALGGQLQGLGGSR